MLISADSHVVEPHDLWLDAVNHAHAAYIKLAEKLNAKLADPQAATAAMLPPDADRTTRRKTARQAARSVLPNSSSPRAVARRRAGSTVITSTRDF